MKSYRLVTAAASLALVSGFLPSSGTAAVSIGARDNIQIGGFFSQGYLYSSNNNYPTSDKGGTWDFREMGLNTSTTLGAHLRVGAQVFAQRLGSIGDDKVMIDWAVADYNFSSAFGLRVGRVKYPKGIYGEALDLDVVRPFAFLPGAVYSPVMRDFSAAFNGAMAYGSLNAGRSSFDYKLFYGDIPMSPSRGVAEFYNNSGLIAKNPGIAQLGMDSVTGGQLIWNTPVSGLRFAYSLSVYKNLVGNGPFGAYPAATIYSRFDRYPFVTWSGEFARGDWTIATEWQRSGGNLKYWAPPVLPLVEDHSGWDGWYVSVARRFAGRFEAGTYYGYMNDRYTSQPKSNPRSHQQDIAVSLRFDVSEHLLIKVESHVIDGTYQTFDTVRIPNPGATRKDTTTLFVAKTTLSF